MSLSIVIALILPAFVLGIIFELILRAINERGTVYGTMDIEVDENGECSGKIMVDEDHIQEVPGKRRLVLKIRTRNKDFNGSM